MFKKIIWTAWLMVTAAVAGFYGYKVLISDDKQALLIGDASHGHYQIELACDACHSEAFGGIETIQDACVSCHGQELEDAHDSHPKKKFTDPRNADRIEILDARYCVSCHAEHQEEQTRAMGVTLPDDYCYHCHTDVVEERESHKGLAFDSCASAGCHNYHDNRALYEDFLVDNSGGEWLKEVAEIAESNAAKSIKDFKHHPHMGHPFVEQVQAHPEVVGHWQASAHAQAGVECGGCHASADQSQASWIMKPTLEQCQTCHSNEAESFQQGKHGMRLVHGFDAIKPEGAQLTFSESASQKVHGCNSCHSAHHFDTKNAAVEGCLQCHADEHSLAFQKSPHGMLNARAQSGELSATEAVTCATCHMPRIETKVDGKDVIMVQHNQNDNLRPNEKMIRPVCMQCHSLEFSIDALADEALIKNNFSGKPRAHIESVDWARKRVEGD